jgi:outer membrane protein W
MRKTLLALAALGLSGLSALPASASDFTVFGSYWNTKDADKALGAGAKLRFGYVELRGTYYSDVTADTSPESRDFEIKAIPLEAGLVYKIPTGAAFSPYIGAGGGYYFLDTNRGQIDDEAGWYAVAGGDFGRTSSGLAFNAEVMYRNMEATIRDRANGTDIESKVPFDLSGLTVNAGLTWHF